IRDLIVTGVQTCALPICPFTLSDRCSTAGMAYRLNQVFGWYSRTPLNASSDRWSVSFTTPALVPTPIADCAATGKAAARSNAARSEERRVGKEGRGRVGG